MSFANGSPLADIAANELHRRGPSYTSLQMSGSSQSLFPMDDIVEERPRPSAADAAIPCPRLFGAVFGWDGRIVMFNNLIRLQDVSNSSRTLPRTYRDLRSAVDLVMEDIDDYEPHHDLSSDINAPSSAPATLSADMFAVDDLPAADEYFRAFYQQDYHGEFPLHRYHEEPVAFESSGDDASASPTRDSPCTSVMIFSLPTLFPLSTTLASQYSLNGASASAICEANAAKAHAAQHSLHAWVWKLAARLCRPKDSDRAAAAWRYHAFGGRLAERLVLRFMQLNDIQLATLLSSVFQMPPSCGGFGSQFPSVSSSSENALQSAGPRANDKLALQYAEILTRLGLLSARAEVLSLVHADPAEVEAAKVQFPLDDTVCYVCRTHVKGVMQFCTSCLHGGHGYHLLEWFRYDSECPSGCGCSCRSLA